MKNNYSQFISVKGKKTLRKSHVQLWEEIRKSRLKRNGGFLLTKFIDKPTFF